MKLVQINCVYPHGSTGKITRDIHLYMRERGVDSHVIYGVGGDGASRTDPALFQAAPEWIRKAQSLRSRITGYAYSGCLFSTRRILRELDRIEPDLVHLQCPNAYMVDIYRLIEYLKRKKIPTVLTLHAEFMYTAGCSYAIDCPKWKSGCGHCDKIGRERPSAWLFDRTAREWKKMQRAYKGFETLTVCAVSDWLGKRASQSPFFQGKKIQTVLNGLDTEAFALRDGAELREKLRLRDQKVVLHVTPDFHNTLKGGAHVLEMARRFPAVRFLVVGAKDIEERVSENVMLISHTQNPIELAQYYSMADLCLLPSVRETFSMVCAESLCCGTPVVGFQAGAPETISLPEYSEFVAQGDDDLLEEALHRWLNRPVNKNELSQKAREVYAREKMCRAYWEIYHQLLS